MTLTTQKEQKKSDNKTGLLYLDLGESIKSKDIHHNLNSHKIHQKQNKPPQISILDSYQAKSTENMYPNE